MKKFFILIICFCCICLLAIPALAADEAGASVSNAGIYRVDDDTVIVPLPAVDPGDRYNPDDPGDRYNPDDPGDRYNPDDPDDWDVYEVDDDTWVIGPPIEAPVPPEQRVAPLPVHPAPPSGAPRPAEGKGPAIDPEPKPESMPPRDDYEPTQESLEDILGLDEIFRIPEEEYEIYVEREESHVDTPAIESEPKWAFGAGITRWGRLTPAEMRLALTSSRHGAVQLRVVKVGNKLYFLGLRPGSKLILVDTTSLEIIRIVDVVRPTLSVDKPFAGKRILAILVDENLVYQSSRVIGG